MQIRAFPPHYQLVHTNFDISPFSLISYVLKSMNPKMENRIYVKHKKNTTVWSKRDKENKNNVFLQLFVISLVNVVRRLNIVV